MRGISHCLWFDSQAEEAAHFYVSVFREAGLTAHVGKISRYTDVGQEQHGQPPGKVMTVEFELDGNAYLGLNGGPIFPHTEAFSICLNCDTQEEIDYFWRRLTEGGGKEIECGWLKDRFGVSWQVNPAILSEMLVDPDVERVRRVTRAFLAMKKFDIAALKRAYEGR